MRLAIVSASSSAIFRILLRPSRTTCTTWASFTVSRLQNGGITCFSIRCATWRRHRDALSITHRVKKGRAFYSSMKMIKLKLILKAANIMKSFQFYVYRTSIPLTSHFLYTFHVFGRGLPDLSSRLLSGYWWPRLLLSECQSHPKTYIQCKQPIHHPEALWK